MSFFRYDTTVQTPLGPAVAGASVAVLTDPSDFTTQPGTPLASIFSAATSNAATITAASWIAQEIIFTFTSVPADVVVGSYIGVLGVNPVSYNSTLQAPWLVLGINGNQVAVQSFVNPGTYVSGGTVATSLLPNPTTSDSNGHVFFYAAAGLYGVQIYGPIAEQDYPDQGVGGFGGGGGITSIGLTMPGQFAVTGSPLTSNGTLGVAWTTEAANQVLAGPTSGGAALPTFRALVASDIPSLPYVTSVGFTMSGPAIFTFATGGTPVTGSGVISETIGLATQTANTVWAGPKRWVAPRSRPFRPLVSADLPSTVVPFKVEAFNVTPVTVNTSTAETTLMTFTLPANELGSAQALVLKASGTNAMANAETLTLRLYIDSTVIVSGLSTSTGAAGTFGWEANAQFMIASTGAGGTIEVSGDLTAALQGATPLYQENVSNAVAALAFDTTASHVIKLTAQHSVSAAGDTATQRQLLINRIG